jgi:hypothetical protein
MFNDELLNQQYYRDNCKRILNNQLSNDITVLEYLSYLNYDEYYYKELTDNLNL